MESRDLRQVEIEFSHRESALAEAQRLAQVGSWRWDLATDVVIWSEELYRIFGLDPKEPAPSFPEQSQIYQKESWNRLLQAVETAQLTGSSYELDLEIVRSDDVQRWVRARGEVQYDDTGKIIALHGTVQDVTDRKVAEERLRESEEKFRSVFHNAGIGMIIVSPQGRFLAANNIFCEYLGYTEEELQRLDVTAVTHPDDWPAFSKMLEEALTQGTVFHRFQKRCLHKSGRVVYTESSASVVRGPDGEPQYFVGEVLDVTQRMLADEALSSVNRKLIQVQEQERARIARELHDDIGQNIALLTIKMEELKRTLPMRREEVKARLDQLIQRVGEISDDIHTISHRLHSSKLEHLGITTAMGSFCKEYSEHQKVEIQFSHDAIPPGISEEISLCLFRVLQESLQNAVKHSGTRHFNVRLFGSKNEIGLKVSDAGLGFDPDAVKNQQGLGLISMRERLRLVQGTISVVSKPNSGTIICAQVPLIHRGT